VALEERGQNLEGLLLEFRSSFGFGQLARMRIKLKSTKTPTLPCFRHDARKILRCLAYSLARNSNTGQCITAYTERNS